MKKKITAICLVVALAAVAIVGGTLAFFTDTTDEVENTFTMGNVNIDLTETSKADDDNNVVAGEENETNGFDYENMMPGFTYSKVPTITVEDGSQDCYVFLKMDLTQYVSLINLMMVNEGYEGTTTEFVNELAADKAKFQEVIDKWFIGINHADWEIMNLSALQTAFAGWTEPGSNPTALSLIFGYIGGDVSGTVTMVAGDSVDFMEGFAIPDTVTSEMLEEDAYANGDTDITGMSMTFTAYAIQAEGIEDITAAYGEMFPST